MWSVVAKRKISSRKQCKSISHFFELILDFVCEEWYLIYPASETAQ
jgi:hypothetical protein